MRILLTAAGSRGDVAPYTGLGARLRREGHEVSLATHDSFAPLAEEAGLAFRRLPADPRGRGTATGKRELMRTAAAFVRELALGLAEAAAQDTDLLLLSTTTAPLGWHISEATGVPTLGAYLVPSAPTGDFAPVVGGTRSLGRWGNRAAGRLAGRMLDRIFADAVRDLRTHLGLPPAAPAAARRRQEAADWPVLHGFSTALLPRPADWRPGLTVVGNWWPHHADPQLPAIVEDFLTAGPPPVFIGFGSMAKGDGERLGELAADALRRAGLRGLLQSGGVGLAADGDDLLTIGEVPHALLFPRVAAVVHHAGAGTAAAALRAGVPAVPVPVTADQPFWANRLAALGAATAPIPFAGLTAERLADALTRAVTEPSYADAAGAAARTMAAEDGAGRVAEAVERLVTGKG